MSIPPLPAEPTATGTGTGPVDDRRVEALARYGFDAVAPTPGLRAITRLAARTRRPVAERVDGGLVPPRP